MAVSMMTCYSTPSLSVMKFSIKATVAALAIGCASASGAAIKKADLEYSFVIGWDLIGKLRACSAFDDSLNYHMASAKVEQALLKFVRKSNLLEANYPENQAGKVAVQASVNAMLLGGTVLSESKEAAAKMCKKAAQKDAPEFMEVLQDISNGNRNMK